MVSTDHRSLSEADKIHIFRIATRGLARSYASEIEDGMTDEALAAALGQVLGIFGGSGGPDTYSVTFAGAGLRIWGGWYVINHVTEKPLFAGKQTVAMARHIYGIRNPDDRQLDLF